MRICLSLLAALCALLLLAGVAPAGEKADVRIERGAKPDLLAKEISVEFNEKPLSEVCEVLAKLTGVKITCDKELAGARITLRITKTRARLAMKWFAKMARAGVEFRKDGSVRITKHARVKTVKRVYDVGFLGSPGKEPNAAAVEEMILRRISPDTWGRNKRSLSVRDGKLVVVQTEEVQEAIAKLLKDLRPAKPVKAIEPDEKASLEFIGTPAKDVVAYVAQRGKLNIIIDPNCNTLMEAKLTFKAEGMKLRQVLDWALLLSGTERQFKDGMIYITPKGTEKKIDAREAARALLLKEKDGFFRKPAEFEPPPEVTLPVLKK